MSGKGRCSEERKVKKIIVMAVIFFLPALSFAKGEEDLVNCRWKTTGQPISAKVCDALRRYAAEDQAKAAAEAAQREKAREIRAKHEEALRIQKERDMQQIIEYQKKEEAVMAQWEAERIQNQRAEAERQEIAAARLKERKERCGSDYRTPSIGMSLARARDCVGDFKLQGQATQADGVVSTYRYDRLYLRVREDKVVSWGRYQRRDESARTRSSKWCATAACYRRR
jgi:hypothetical protein